MSPLSHFFLPPLTLSLSLSQEGQPKERRKNEDAFDSFGGGGGDKSEGVLLNNRAHKEGFFFFGGYYWVLLGFTGFRGERGGRVRLFIFLFSDAVLNGEEGVRHAGRNNFSTFFVADSSCWSPRLLALPRRRRSFVRTRVGRREDDSPPRIFTTLKSTIPLSAASN